jgi:hypothetical protein
MRRGDWLEAWRQTDRIELPRREQQSRGGFLREPHHLVWDGRDFAGRSVLVRCEHGLGDTLQFIRYVPLVSAQSRELHLLVQPHLLRLLTGAPGLGQVYDAWSGAPPPVCEVEIEVMELAYAFRTSVQTVPAPYPGLPLPGERGPALALPRDGRLRVGLVWAASDWDTSRSIPFALLRALLQTSGATFFSLQQGAAAADPAVASSGIVALSPYTTDIAQAAAAMLELDLVITVDGMTAHLAGTLGRPTWVLLKHDADWRWMTGRNDTPWYPTMRLFRQLSPGDWRQVVRDVTDALRAYR